MTDAISLGPATPPGRVLTHLIRLGLLDAETANDGYISLIDASRSNPVHIVVVDQVPRYVVKEAGAVVDAGLPVDAEIIAYRWLADEPCLGAVAPHVVSLPAAGGLLVLEALAGARPSHEVIGQLDGEFVGLVVEVARSLARLHATGASSSALQMLPSHRPWLLDLPSGTCPGFAIAHKGAQAVVADLRAERELMAVVEDVARTWRARSVIHGDVKWDNVLVRPEPDGGWHVWLIDWELFGRGDPAWDLAGLVEGILMSFTCTSADVAVAAGVPVVRAAIEAYQQIVGGDFLTTPQRLIQVVAARLIQAVIQLSAMDGDPDALAATQKELRKFARDLASDPATWASTLLGEGPRTD